MAKIGSNVKVVDSADSIVITIMKNVEMESSSTGRSKILANTGGFKSLEGVKGFKNKDIGLNLCMTVRDAKKQVVSMDDDEDEEPVKATPKKKPVKKAKSDEE